MRLAPGLDIPDDVLVFTQVAGGGPGGQHANKTATRVEVRLPLAALPLPWWAAERLAAEATAAGELVLTCDETRSARQNRELVLERLCRLVRDALVRPKVRKRTRPSRASRERRLEAKRGRSERLRDRRVD